MKYVVNEGYEKKKLPTDVTFDIHHLGMLHFVECKKWFMQCPKKTPYTAELYRNREVLIWR